MPYSMEKMNRSISKCLRGLFLVVFFLFGGMKCIEKMLKVLFRIFKVNNSKVRKC